MHLVSMEMNGVARLADAIYELTAEALMRPRVIQVRGPSGSGKSLWLDVLRASLDAAVSGQRGAATFARDGERAKVTLRWALDEAEAQLAGGTSTSIVETFFGPADEARGMVDPSPAAFILRRDFIGEARPNRYDQLGSDAALVDAAAGLADARPLTEALLALDVVPAGLTRVGAELRPRLRWEGREVTWEQLSGGQRAALRLTSALVISTQRRLLLDGMDAYMDASLARRALAAGLRYFSGDQVFLVHARETSLCDEGTEVRPRLQPREAA